MTARVPVLLALRRPGSHSRSLSARRVSARGIRHAHGARSEVVIVGPQPRRRCCRGSGHASYATGRHSSHGGGDAYMVVEVSHAMAAVVEAMFMFVLGLFSGCGLGTQLCSALAVPAVDLGIRLGGEGFLWQIRGKHLAVVGILEVPVPHGVLHERNVLLGREQDFDRLPSYEALYGQRGDVGLLVVVIARLKRVLAACDLPYVGDSLVRDFVEEGIVVTTNGFVEGCELYGGQVILVLVTDLIDLVRAQGWLAEEAV